MNLNFSIILFIVAVVLNVFWLSHKLDVKNSYTPGMPPYTPGMPLVHSWNASIHSCGLHTLLGPVHLQKIHY